jgi:hypothetical protein
MKATLTLLAGLTLAAAVPAARADHQVAWGWHHPSGCATQHLWNYHGAGAPSYPLYLGTVYQPGMNVRPPGAPFTMLGPGMPQVPSGRQLGFPTHPFARSPRDFFMFDLSR